MDTAKLLCQPGIAPQLCSVLGAVADRLYALMPKGAETACVFTSTVLAEVLAAAGFDVRVTGVAVEGRGPEARFGIGHPDYPLTRPNAWKGHVCCMVGNVLIDPTISQARRYGAPVPLIVALPTPSPLMPSASCRFGDWTLTWQPEGAAASWPDHPDLRHPLRRKSVRRIIAAAKPHLHAGIPLSRAS